MEKNNDKKSQAKISIRKAVFKNLKAITNISKIVYLDIPDFYWDTRDWNKVMIKEGNY